MKQLTFNKTTQGMKDACYLLSPVSCQRSVVKCPTRGFTLIELLVSITIFTIMTSVVLAKYNTYNINAPFANASEDVVMALRQAQVYGVGVKGCGTATPFDCGYGIYFNSATPDRLKIFADASKDGVYGAGDTSIQDIIWRSPVKIKVPNGLKCGVSQCVGDVLNVVFTRPLPDAVINANASAGNYVTGSITLTNGIKESTITISNAGQISLQ